jgi:hypothetical protein
MSSKTLSSVLEEVREVVARFEFGVWADDVRQPEAGVRVALLQVGRSCRLPSTGWGPVAGHHPVCLPS